MRSAQESFVKVRGRKMGYYDFDDHFWAPYEVCQQKSEIVAQEEKFSLIEKLHSCLRRLRHRNMAISELHNEENLPNKNSEK